MRFMILRRSDDHTEAGLLPPQEMISAMGKYKAALQQAGVFVSGDGLLPTARGARVHYQDGHVSVTDGPFAETKELVAGFLIVDVESLEEAVKWATMCPSLCGRGEAVMEVRQVAQLSDFPTGMEAQLAQMPWDTLSGQANAKQPGCSG
jgi:hypothetical protein